MKYFATCLSIICICFSSIALAQDPQTAEIESAGITIEYQGEWELNEPVQTPDGKIQVDLTANPENDDLPLGLIRFETMPMQPGQAQELQDQMAEVQTAVILGLHESLQDFVLISLRQEELFGNPSVTLDFRCVNDAGVTVRQRMKLVALKGPDRWVVIAANTAINQWDRYEPQIAAVLGSIKLLEPAD